MDAQEEKIFNFVFEFLNYVEFCNIFDAQEEKCKKYYIEHKNNLSQSMEIEKNKFHEIMDKMQYSKPKKTTNNIKWI